VPQSYGIVRATRQVIHDPVLAFAHDRGSGQNDRQAGQLKMAD
jgi:hypothetical protein